MASIDSCGTDGGVLARTSTIASRATARAYDVAAQPQPAFNRQMECSFFETKKEHTESAVIDMIDGEFTTSPVMHRHSRSISNRSQNESALTSLTLRPSPHSILQTSFALALHLAIFEISRSGYCSATKVGPTIQVQSVSLL